MRDVGERQRIKSHRETSNQRCWNVAWYGYCRLKKIFEIY